MTTAGRTFALIALSAVLTLVAVVDAARDGSWDLLAVLALVLVLQAAVLTGARARRPSVSLRGDLHRWVTGRSAATGEPLERVVDRCVAAYRDGITREPGEGR
ncbi:hypothetical protein ACFFMN_39125 [Planobispora siamensis]|uniref:Uncharacterized protein n=1 Tax=Planobispora siamensis TaxID=936338 RepID=A0A8J3SPI9_9ACTN|nr:hypothetical protein [Planobispora siamensis]GIH96325.1 hypothetical protein Psi01_69550 [Planobispora siamensis]